MKNPYLLVAVIDREDGSVTDTGSFILGEFASEDSAVAYAEKLESMAQKLDEQPFALAVPVTKPAKWQGEPTVKQRQKVLLTGMDCLANQQDLFET